MKSQIILKFNSLKPLEKVILIIGLIIGLLICIPMLPDISEEVIGISFFLLVILLPIIVYIVEKLRLKNELKCKYKQALENFNINPHDSDMYTMALTLGKKYYNLSILGSFEVNDQLVIDDLTPILKAEYERTLNELRNNPQDSILRKKALEIARTYYGTMRGGVITIYDEQAISNDLSTIYGSDIDQMSS